MKKILVDGVTRQQENVIKTNISETVLARLRGQTGHLFVVTDSRVCIIKTAGYKTAITYGSKFSSFRFNDILGFEVRKNLMLATLVIVSKSSTAIGRVRASGFGKNNARSSDRAVTFSSSKLLRFQAGVNLCNDLIDGTIIIEKEAPKDLSTALDEINKAPATPFYNC